ncbi:beta-galactosidase [Paenarthrobacter ureafaciens]
MLYRSGEPYRILAGAIHYFRVHPELWQDRLRRLKAYGSQHG